MCEMSPSAIHHTTAPINKDLTDYSICIVKQYDYRPRREWLYLIENNYGFNKTHVSYC